MKKSILYLLVVMILAIGAAVADGSDPMPLCRARRCKPVSYSLK